MEIEVELKLKIDREIRIEKYRYIIQMGRYAVLHNHIYYLYIILYIVYKEVQI